MSRTFSQKRTSHPSTSRAASRVTPSLQRPRSQSLSLSEYHPLSLDRDVLESRYRTATSQPNSSCTSLEGGTGTGSNESYSYHDVLNGGGMGNGSGEGRGGSSSLAAMLSHTEESNPSLSTGTSGASGNGFDAMVPPLTPRTPTNFAGVGAGHSLTPPSSPFHLTPATCSAQKLGGNNTGSNGTQPLSPVPGSPSLAPNLPPRPFPVFSPPQPAVALPPDLPPRSGMPGAPGVHGQSGQGWAGSDQSHSTYGHSSEGPRSGLSDSEGDERIRSRGKRRALPGVPSNVPAPIPPEWQPDYKSTIPPELIAPSAQYAYSRLSEPPPNLPPRRHRAISGPASTVVATPYPPVSYVPPGSISAERSVRPAQSRKRTCSAGTATRLENLGISNESHRYPTGEGYGDSYAVGNGYGTDQVDVGTMNASSGPSRLPPAHSAPSSGQNYNAPGPLRRAEQSTSMSNPTTGVDGRIVPPRLPPAPLSSTDQPILSDEPGALTTSPPTSAIDTSFKPLPSAPAAPTRPRPNPETDVSLSSTGKTPIWSTHYFDPCLKSSLITMPHGISAAANATLSGLSAYPHERFNTTIGAPIDGLAKLAKEWVVPPDGRFTSESGPIELGLAVIDRGGEEWGNKKGRKKARVEVNSKSGGIKVDIIEIDFNRQLDLRIETKSGDVLVFLPDTFHGPIHVTASQPPIFQPILAPQVEPVANPYENFYTTLILPLRLPPEIQVELDAVDSQFDADGNPIQSPSSISSRTRSKSSSGDHNVMQKIAKNVPKRLRGQNDYLDMARAGYAAWGRAEQSKVSIQAAKGRVVFAYRESADEASVKELGLKVGIQQDQGKGKKKWWHL